MRLDISWRDLLRGLMFCLTKWKRHPTSARIEAEWAPDGDGMVCLSVRSGLDLILTSLQLPPGSEVLYSAINIPHMTQIAREHGLTPVPVDLCGPDLQVDPESLSHAVSKQSRVLVVAHLFGATVDLSSLIEATHKLGLFVVEDCAQSWSGPTDRGHPNADASLFSFGPLKTATAMGGALVRVSDRQLMNRMRVLQSSWKIQSQNRYGMRLAMGLLQSIIATHRLFGAFVWLGRIRGQSIDELLDRWTRVFPQSDLMNRIRQQPCAALLRLLEHRLRTYDRSRIEQRAANARTILADSPFPSRNTFWVCPVHSDEASELISLLRAAGIDSVHKGRLSVLEPPADRSELTCVSAHELLERTVFVPCYPELPGPVVADIASVIASHRMPVDNVASRPE